MKSKFFQNSKTNAEISPATKTLNFLHKTLRQGGPEETKNQKISHIHNKDPSIPIDMQSMILLDMAH